MSSSVKPDWWDDLIQHLRDGGSILSWISAAPNERPKRWQVYDVVWGDAVLEQQFARAREQGAESRWENAEAILRGVEGHTTGDRDRDRWLAEHQYKTAACFRPQRYGAKAIAGQIAAAQDGQTTTIQIVTGVPAPDSNAAKEG